MLVKKLDLRPAIALSRCGRARSSIRNGKSRITRGESIATGPFFENRIVASENWMPIKIPLPELQIEFSVALAEIRRLYLRDALQDTVRTMDISSLDQQIGKFIPGNSIKTLAAHSLRAELIFPVPILFHS